MGLIGSSYSFATNHPQDLVNDLYNEIFSLHPDDAEIDVALAVEKDNSSETRQVINYYVLRVSDGQGGNRFLAESIDPNGTGLDMLKEMHAWAKRNDYSFMWIHKHPEGLASATSKDRTWSSWLTAIDFATNAGAKRRTYLGCAVVNRGESDVVVPDRMPMPNTPDMEINVGVATEAFNRWAEVENLPADHPTRALVAELREAALAEDAERTTELVDKLMRAITLHNPVAAAEISGNLPPGIRQMIERIMGDLPPGVEIDGIEVRRRGADGPIPMSIPANLSEILRLPESKNPFDLPAMDNVQQANEKKDLLN